MHYQSCSSIHSASTKIIDGRMHCQSCSSFGCATSFLRPNPMHCQYWNSIGSALGVVRKVVYKGLIWVHSSHSAVAVWNSLRNISEVSLPQHCWSTTGDGPRRLGLARRVLLVGRVAPFWSRHHQHCSMFRWRRWRLTSYRLRDRSTTLLRWTPHRWLTTFRRRTSGGSRTGSSAMRPTTHSALLRRTVLRWVSDHWAPDPTTPNPSDLFLTYCSRPKVGQK